MSAYGTTSPPVYRAPVSFGARATSFVAAAPMTYAAPSVRTSAAPPPARYVSAAPAPVQYSAPAVRAAPRTAVVQAAPRQSYSLSRASSARVVTAQPRYVNATPTRAAAAPRTSIAMLDEFNALNRNKGNKAHDYNPEWKPNGFEGGIDTNTLPWIPSVQLPGCSIKPLRASQETAGFTLLVHMPAGTVLPAFVHLGMADTLVLSGKLSYSGSESEVDGCATPGVWGYVPANSLMSGMTAHEDTEFMWTLYGPIAILTPDRAGVKSLITSASVRIMAYSNGLTLLPNTLEEAMEEPPPAYSGKADPTIMAPDCYQTGDIPAATELTNPHWVDTNKLPWIVNPESPDIAIKIMRISSETGTTSMIVKQNGQAPPHYHLGPADFFILNGRIGYRAGPPEGFGPGTYMLEPAGARHESTQPVEKDLVYTANVWGPIAFDSGVGTPVTMVLSWMTYLEGAKAFNSPMLASTFNGDKGVWLAHTP
eukprot:TRINITY_DN36005_c0_g1_i1.p1 TRINITY_DN36005_c0_g1~~TRINITY_DN36005_c0_g1_i1.p1  ORF type:complete len:480 (-),score=108.73 TRINITY_DN36005_c0_g1_i1:245-1684(-)